MYNALDLDYGARLRGDYLKHGSLFVAFDFDNTVYDYHMAGIDYSEIINLLKECYELDFTLILFTSNEGRKLEDAEYFLKNIGVKYSYVNENPAFKTRKPYYNVLLDDRAGLVEAYTMLRELIDEIQDE
jgi:hypothetical protein